MQSNPAGTKLHKLKILQLNIFKGKYVERIIEFINAGDFDVIQLQEVSGGDFSFSKGDVFEKLKQNIGFEGEIVKYVDSASKKGSYFGNATFFKKGFKLIKKDVIWLSKFKPDFVIGRKFASTPRAALALKLGIFGKELTFLNAHLARGPTPFDAVYKIKQALKIGRFIEKLNSPYVLTGDFNVVGKTRVVKNFEKLGRNLISEYKIAYTLNPAEHFLKNEVIKKQMAIDFAFVSKDLSVDNFELVTENLSDHYGLKLEIAF